jgi:serine/threonine-protein kinase
VVLRAYDSQLHRDVALKLLAPERLADPQSLARFQREATAVSRLKHAHMAGIYEIGELNGQPFLVMEWVEGRTLQALLKEKGALPLEEALRLFEQMTQAIDYAHKHELVHRDIKPANIMVNDQGQATIVDFGLATAADSISVTETGTVLGTPLYMAPEQINGDPATSRADLYALAVVFYEMVSGRPPFEGEHMASIIYSKVHKDPPRLSDKAPLLGSSLDHVLTKALAREPEHRFESGKALWEALRVPPPPPPSPVAPAARKPWALGAVALLVGAGAFLAWPRAKAPVAVPLTPTPVATASAPASAASELWAQKCPQLEGLVAAAGRLILATEGGLLQAWDPATGKPQWEAGLKEAPACPPVHVEMTVLVATESRLQAFAADTGRALWSREEEEPAGLSAGPDGTLFLSAKNEVVAYDGSSEELHRFKLPGALLAPVSDGGRLYAASAVGVTGWDLKTKKQLWQVPLKAPLQLARSEDRVLVADAETLGALSGSGGTVLWEFTLPGKPVGLACAGPLTVVSCEDGQVAALESDGTVRWQVHPEQELGVAPLISEDEVLVAGVKAFHRLDLKSGQELASFPTPDAWLPPVVAGDRLILTAAGGVTAYAKGSP